MRALLFLLGVAGIGACGHARDTGPAWPAPSTTEEDGGQSIDPPSPVAAAIEKADEPEDEKPASSDADAGEEKADEATPEKDDSDEATPASDSTDEPVMTEEIIIEIDDQSK